MSDGLTPIRSYQRIFRPDRRIYQVDGRRLPVPGGVPLNWLAWSLASIVAILVVASRSLLFSALAGIVAGLLYGSRGRRTAVAAGCVVFAGVQVCGLVLGWLDWPLRLVVLPVVIATMAGQVSADGRSAHRYVLSRLLLRLRAERRSLERPLAVDGERCEWAPRVWIAPDHGYPVLHHGRVHGPARLVFGEPVVLTRRRGRHVVRLARTHRIREGDATAHVVELADGQVVEVRP
jgi:hypothetical protein